MAYLQWQQKIVTGCQNKRSGQNFKNDLVALSYRELRALSQKLSMTTNLLFVTSYQADP